MKVTSVFQCTQKIDRNGDGSQVELTFSPPYCIDATPGVPFAAGDDARWQRVNEGWSKYTPCATITKTVTNPAAAAAFEQGEYYTVTFEKYSG